MISTLTGNSNSVIENKNEVSRIKSARLLCENVYNVAHGQIVFIGTQDGRAFVNVKCNPSEVLRYGNLKELTCEKSYFANIGAQLGVADDYVIFEYCTLWKGQSNFPVRINNWTYYKQDPTDILEGRYTVRRDGAQEVGFVNNRDRIRFTEDQKKLFGENILDKNDKIAQSQVWSTKKSLRALQAIGWPHQSKSDFMKDREIPEEGETDV